MDSAVLDRSGVKGKERSRFFKILSFSLAASVFISCSGNQKNGDLQVDFSDSESLPRAASCSDYTTFRYFYTDQRQEGLSGWEIAYLLSLGYTPDELTAMDFDQKRLLLLPGVTGISEGGENYDKLHPDDQEKLAGFGMTASDFEGLTAIGFQNIEWLSREKIEFLLPLDTLRERLEPDVWEERVFFDGYQKLFEDRWDLEEVEAVYTAMEERGITREEAQFMRNMGITFEEMLALPEPELHDLLGELRNNETTLGRESQ